MPQANQKEPRVRSRDSRDVDLSGGSTTTSPTAEMLIRSDSSNITTPTSELLELSGHLRSHARQVEGSANDAHEQASDLHRELLQRELERRTVARSRESVTSLLEYLEDAGFSWTDIGRLVSVSVPALRKWRRGEGVSAANRRAVAQLVGFCDLASGTYLVEDVASWMEMPIVDAVPVSCIDVYSSGRIDLALEYTAGHLDPSDVLDRFDTDWRERYAPDTFRLFMAPDGHPALRSK